MSPTADITPAIIELYYDEALGLAEEARAAFDFSRYDEPGAAEGDTVRIILSCEALRTTTRMMHSLAWLLNQRAFFRGEISEFQLRRHGRLPAPQPESDPGQLALLAPEIQDLILRTLRFHARIERLDAAWRDRFSMEPSAIHRLRERIGERM